MVTKAEKRALRLKKKDSEIKKQRNAAARRRRNKKIINYGVIGIIIILVAFGGYTQYAKSKAPGLYDEFATCMTNSGTGMYGIDTCSHCQDQKRLFGKSFQFVTYINCQKSSGACENQGVTSFPTWIYGDGTRESGVQSLEHLAEKTGCSLV